MISIEFTDEAPKGKFLWGSAIYDSVKEEEMVPVLKEAFRCKPHEPVIEAFLEQKGEIVRHLVVKIGAKGKSKKQDREAAGAALYKKALGGIEKALLLDLRQLEEDGLDLLTGILLSS